MAHYYIRYMYVSVHIGGSLAVHWPKRWIMDLDWTGIFDSPTALVYQVNIGLSHNDCMVAL